jgi:hypothetical protein
MRSLPRLVRGSANWPFIIALLLLLLFVYLWFDASDQRDKNKIEADKQKALAGQANYDAQRAYEGWRDLSNLVGWRTVTKRYGADDYALTDVAKARVHLDPNGMDGDRPGLHKFLADKATISIIRSLHTAKADKAEEKPTDFTWMKAGFKAKVQQVLTLAQNIPPKPAPPVDPDDAGAVAKYTGDVEAYEAAVRELEKSIDELKGMEGWNKYNEVIRSQTLWDPDRTDTITVNYFRPSGNAIPTFEEMMTAPQDVITLILEDYSKNKSADAANIDTLKRDLEAKEQTIASSQASLAKEQSDHVATRTALQAEVTAGTEALERVRSESVKWQTLAAQNEQGKKDAERAAATKIGALESRIANDKEWEDLAIRRDDPDGRVLSASVNLGTGTIDLGSADHVFPGLKFTVSYVDRGGDRQAKGEVMVRRVTGPHSSQVTILSATSPIVTGDIISNPFFDASEAIHVWFYAGKPDEIALARLNQLGVVVDLQPSADTKYLVIPNDLKAVGTEAPPEGGDGAAPAAAGDDPLSRVEKMARTFGARVITQKMLEHFVNP